MRRRILIVFAGLLGVLCLAVATLPFWLGAALERGGARVGLRFNDYVRIGYARFALTNVAYESAALQATAQRVEVASPVAWLWQRAFGEGAELRVDEWSVTVKPAAKSAQTQHDSDRSGGWVPLRATIRDLVGRVEPWVERAAFGPGLIRLPQQTVAVGRTTWEDRVLTVTSVTFGERTFHAQLAVPTAVEEIRLTARTETDEARLAVTSGGAAVEGELQWWGEPARFTAQFPAQGWLPERAELVASDWNLPADKLKLGDHFAAVQGDANVSWRRDGFALELSAQSTPLERKDAAPPLDVQLRAHGTLQAITVERFRAQAPGAFAELTAPVTIARSGEIRGESARLTTQVDLAELPWVEATGTVSGELEILSRTNAATAPPVIFQLSGRNIAADQVAVQSTSLRGRLDWPRLQVEEALIEGEHGEPIRARGGWDFEAKEVLGATVSGELRPATVARWLPQGLDFERIQIDATAEGSVAELRHRGSVEVAALAGLTVQPLDMTLEWNGVGKRADRIVANLAAGESRLSLTAAADLKSARLSDLEFVPAGSAPVRLTQPATLRWADTLQLEGLALKSDTSAITADLTWGEAGRVALTLRQIPSSWLRDFIALPGPAWTVTSLAVTGQWDRGPLAFTAVADAVAPLRDRGDIRLALHLRGDGNGTELVALRALEQGAAVVSASGRGPVTLVPRGSPALRINQNGAIALSLRTVENETFWSRIGELAGVTIEAPRITAEISGTWREPKGEVRGDVRRVALAGKDGKSLPPLENLSLALRGDRRGIAVERLALAVENQRIAASGHLPLPEKNWAELREDPLAYVRRGAEVRVEIPSAEIAAFKDLLPAVVVPQGTLAADIALHNGALNGTLRLQNAATRPLGGLGALHEIEADVRLEGNVIRLESVSAHLGREPAKISGTITLPPLDQALARDAAFEPQFDIALRATQIPLVRRVGTLVRADLDVSLVSARDSATTIRGTVRLRDSLFLQDVRALVPSGTASKTERPPYFAVEAAPFSTWRLDVRVVGDKFMRLRTTLFNGTASADFRLTGTLGEPSLLGEATIDRGMVRLPFANFAVQEGRVSLTPAQPHEPQIFLTATARRYEYDLTMEVSGDASSPALTFESTPPLDHGQIVLMVMAGVVPNDAIAVTQQQRARRLGTYLGSSLLSSFGDGDDTNRLTIRGGEEISDQGRETYAIEYALDDRWALTAEYDEYDTHSVGVKWQALARGGSSTAASSSESFDPAKASEDEGAVGGREAPRSTPDTRARERKPPEINVTGLGWFGGLEMESSLKRLLGLEGAAVLDSHAIEDALFLLVSAIREEGYLRPTIRVTAVDRDGTRREFVANSDLTTPVPRDLTAREVQFEVDRGTHYFVKQLEISGLTALEEEAARAYFVGDPGLFKRQRALTFTPDRLKRGLASLEAALRERGYAEAKATAAEPRIDHRTGEVTLAVSVAEGPPWQIGSVDVEGTIDGVFDPQALSRHVGEPWSDSVGQDLAAEVRKMFLEHGYADARVRIAHDARATNDGARIVAVTARVQPGERVTVGAVRFEGNTRTQEKVLARRVPFGPGDPLNPLAVQRARHRLSRLGVFADVDAEIEPQDGSVRDVVFELQPGKQLEVNLLAGYNTYEHLRAGVEVRRFNLWGRAHQTRGTLVQSMKSTRGEYSYNVPELFGEDVHGTARLSGLQREEVAFLRREFGAHFTIDAPLRFLGANLNAGYTFEVLRNDRSELESRTRDPRQVEVASIQAGLTRDRRDNPLLPRDGYRWFGRAEAASELFGGRAEYQRVELGGTYHQPWGSDRWWHFAAGHGFITTLFRGDEQLPVNKRFFPGGDGSIRGFELGEAAPRGADGRFIGAKTYLSASVELEQRLVEKWSGVVFVDALGSARQLAAYPFENVLVAVGLGVRYQTLIGPARAEYGYNVKRRDRDPNGTFLLSLGFPF